MKFNVNWFEYLIHTFYIQTNLFIMKLLRFWLDKKKKNSKIQIKLNQLKSIDLDIIFSQIWTKFTLLNLNQTYQWTPLGATGLTKFHKGRELNIDPYAK